MSKITYKACTAGVDHMFPMDNNNHLEVGRHLHQDRGTPNKEHIYHSWNLASLYGKGTRQAWWRKFGFINGFKYKNKALLFLEILYNRKNQEWAQNLAIKY